MPVLLNFMFNSSMFLFCKGQLLNNRSTATGLRASPYGYELSCRLVSNYAISFITLGTKSLEATKAIEESTCISWRGKLGVHIDIGRYISFVTISDL